MIFGSSLPRDEEALHPNRNGTTVNALEAWEIWGGGNAVWFLSLAYSHYVDSLSRDYHRGCPLKGLPMHCACS